MTRATTKLRGAAVASAVAAAMACGAGIAQAVEPSLLIEWSGEGRSLRLAPDGTGILSMVSPTAPANRETWSVTWAGDPSRQVTITLASQIYKSATGLGFPRPGDRFLATLQKYSDYTLLWVDSSKSGMTVMFCTLHRTQDAPVCGA